ncbi:UNVERIFIED_CONTAM: Retrovirus-related Pol polyprotein from transposon TNT 1-94 [Sesamum calycinum]|uniref:Retrovirus-related Pol polyprotein from transposon TNT 1-94 n=1 Tax=Sesamum calycinum TaxID=2727403 RepID=A0AAW2MNY4_9LAMI
MAKAKCYNCLVVTLLVNALSQRRYRRNKICDKGSSRIRKLPSSASMQSLHRYGEWRTRGEVENQREINLKVLRTDRRREYLSEQFKRIFEDKGIIRHLTIPYTSQQNGVAERRNQTLLKIARSMMAQANLSISFWRDAILTAAYILNRVPSKSVPSTPYELWHGRKPNLEGLRPWGSAGFSRGGFPKHKVKGNLELYELRDPQGGASITVEGETPRSYPVIDGDNESNPKFSGSCSLDEHNSQNPRMRRSKRGGIPRCWYEIEGESFMFASVDIDEPATYEEAVTSPNANEWITAMKEEMSSMAKNNVWELVDLPTGRKTIGNKWVLKVKRKADGSIDKFKARYHCAHLDLEFFQMDVKTTFLNGELDEEIYMDQPEGFQEMGLKRKVCRLKRSIYGLKQSSRQWYYRFHRAITSIGFTMIEEDHCVYVKRSVKNFLILSLYVDDILLTGNNMEMIVATQKWLSSTFEMKDMGEAEYILV